MKLVSLFCLASATAGVADQWYDETLHSDWKQSFKVSEVLHEERSEFFDLIIFTNPKFGKVMAIDGAIQITEADEYVYQEMLTQVPLLAHGNPKQVLIVGGGDGGMLREVLRHEGVEKVTLVEIDSSVIEFSKKHLSFISQGAFDNPRAEIVIQDGAEFVKNKKDCYDVILCDSSDATGPAAVLFTREFFQDCKEALKDDGIFANMCEVPFMQGYTTGETYRSLESVFENADLYVAAVPTYVGGFMALGFASSKDYTNISLDVLKSRREKLAGRMRYYNPEIHKASFALPEDIKKYLTLE